MPDAKPQKYRQPLTLKLPYPVPPVAFVIQDALSLCWLTDDQATPGVGARLGGEWNQNNALICRQEFLNLLQWLAYLHWSDDLKPDETHTMEDQGQKVGPESFVHWYGSLCDGELVMCLEAGSKSDPLKVRFNADMLADRQALLAAVKAASEELGDQPFFEFAAKASDPAGSSGVAV